MPENALIPCFVEVTSFISGLPVSWMTGVPIPEGNERSSIDEIFWQMSPPDWPLELVGACGQVAYIRTCLLGSSSRMIGRVWLSRPVPKMALFHEPSALRRSSTVRGSVFVLSLVLTAAKTRPELSAFRLMWSSDFHVIGTTCVVQFAAASPAPSVWTAKRNL